MDPVRTLVVDDELPARTRLLTLLDGRSGIQVVGAASDGHEAVAFIREQRPHLLFLDIQMPGLDGFGVLRTVGPALAPVSIFVTAYDRYAIAAFEAHALDYLLKPFSDERFDSALARAIQSVRTLPARDRQLQIESVVEERSAVSAGSGHLDRIVLKEHGRVVLLNVDDVDWIGAAGVYLELHAGKVTHLYRSSLAALLHRLDPTRFVQIHRSVVVNTDRIKELRTRGHSDYTVVLRDGRLVPLSRAYRSQLEGWLRQPL
jgi:two-component system, LytTR family, response regulator